MHLRMIPAILLIACTMTVFQGCGIEKAAAPDKSPAEASGQSVLQAAISPMPASAGSVKTDAVQINQNIVTMEVRDAKGTVLFTTADQGIIRDIVSMLASVKPFTNESAFRKDLGDRDYRLAMNRSDGSVRELAYFSDGLKQTGYVVMEGNKMEPSFDFFRYMENLVSQKGFNTSIPKDVQELFGKYGWTADGWVNTLDEKLPSDLLHDTDEYPVKLYWAYNNELSKSVGYDLSPYLGKGVQVEIYRLRESLPQYMWPRQDARGIMVRSEGKIVGAYIDAGRHASFACSLDGKRIADITGKDWDVWADGYINHDNPLEKKLSAMKPEDIVKAYYDALNRHDAKTVWACLTRKNACSLLSVNMDDSRLYNIEGKDIRVDGNIISAVFIDINEWKMPPASQDSAGEEIEYAVTVDMKFEIEATRPSGKQTWFVILKKESERLGWRIDSIGSGP